MLVTKILNTINKFNKIDSKSILKQTEGKNYEKTQNRILIN